MTPPPESLSPKAQKGILLATLGSVAAAGGLLAWLYLPDPWRLWIALGLAAVGLAVELKGVSLIMEARRERERP